MGGVGAAFLLSLIHCAGPQDSSGPSACPYQGWQGTCSLKQVTKVREVERFPQSFVVYRAVWEPQAGGGTSTPPYTASEYTAPALSEGELVAYLREHALTECQIAPEAGACEAGRVVVALPPFQATAVADVSEPGPKLEGCARLESQGTSGTTQAGPTLDEVFEFAQSSSTPEAASVAQVQQIASMLAQHPEYVCVAVSGGITFGEQVATGEARAKEVKRLLTEAGIDANRLITYGATVGVVGGGAGARSPRPEQRRVTLKVLLVD